MVRLKVVLPELQRIRDAMLAEDAPVDMGALSPAQLRAEFEARGVEPDGGYHQKAETRRRQRKRQQRYHQKRRRH